MHRNTQPSHTAHAPPPTRIRGAAARPGRTLPSSPGLKKHKPAAGEDGPGEKISAAKISRGSFFSRKRMSEVHVTDSSFRAFAARCVKKRRGERLASPCPPLPAPSLARPRCVNDVLQVPAPRLASAAPRRAACGAGRAAGGAHIARVQAQAHGRFVARGYAELLLLTGGPRVLH